MARSCPFRFVYHRDTKIDGSAPCLLYGYGSYGITIPASFNTNCLSLADRGFIYAIAHIRGGKDKGYDWYENGKRLKKMNTFTDFIAASRHLVEQGFTSHDRIVAQGGSGRRHADGCHRQYGARKFWRHHRGSALRRCHQYDARRHAAAHTAGVDRMGQSDHLGDRLRLSWPPIRPTTMSSAQDYPPILAVAGLTDPRVTYWEPAKWVAKLRELKTDNNPVLFRINMDAGHAGASGRFSRLEEVAYVYAYALKLAGKTQT